MYIYIYICIHIYIYIYIYTYMYNSPQGDNHKGHLGQKSHLRLPETRESLPRAALLFAGGARSARARAGRIWVALLV